jgi:hypothetical protein
MLALRHLEQLLWEQQASGSVPQSSFEPPVLEQMDLQKPSPVPAKPGTA